MHNCCLCGFSTDTLGSSHIITHNMKEQILVLLLVTTHPGKIGNLNGFSLLFNFYQVTDFNRFIIGARALNGTDYF